MLIISVDNIRMSTPKKIVLDPDNEVLLLLPNKLTIEWQGPFKLVRKVSVDYVIDIRGKQKVFLVNMLAKFLKPEHPDRKLIWTRT